MRSLWKLPLDTYTCRVRFRLTLLLGSGSRPRSADSSCLLSGSSGTNVTPDPLLSPLQDLDVNMEPAINKEIPRVSSKGIPVVDAIHEIINILKHSKVSLLMLLQIVLDESCKEFAYSRAAFYARRNSQFIDVLELFWNSEKGFPAMRHRSSHMPLKWFVKLSILKWRPRNRIFK